MFFFSLLLHFIFFTHNLYHQPSTIIEMYNDTYEMRWDVCTAPTIVLISYSRFSFIFNWIEIPKNGSSIQFGRLRITTSDTSITNVDGRCARSKPMPGMEICYVVSFDGWSITTFEVENSFSFQSARVNESIGMIE